METPRRIENRNAEETPHLRSAVKIPPSPFMENLGYGTGVTVYRLERSPKCGFMRSPWAVKRTSQRINCNQEDYNSRIQKEAKILKKLCHPNVIGFRGLSTCPDSRDSLILECCGKSLGDILEDRLEKCGDPLPAASILKFIRDISNALDYLHTEAKILHGDLKSYNVLVKGDFEICKLCDFGVSLQLNDDGVVASSENAPLNYIGTMIWSAPEVLDEDKVIDTKADIFSFGLVIYETIALVPPYTLSMTDDGESQDDNDNDNENSTTGDVSCTEICQHSNDGFAKYRRRPLLPEAFELNDEYNAIVELFYCCTNELPEDRPTAKTINLAVQDLHNC